MICLDTARLILRPPADGDAAVLADIHQDPEVAQYLIGVPTVVGPDVAWRNVAMLIGHWHLRGFGSWVVEERATHAVIGRVGFWQSPSWPDVELTWLIRRSHWGQGFATEAAQCALAWACTQTRIVRIISLIQPDNRRSIRMASKLGETFAGERELAGVVHHEYRLDLSR